MPRYLVEAYVPRARSEDGRAAGRCVQEAAEEAGREGIIVTYVRTTFLPDDEMCFLVFDARCAEDVGQVCSQAGLGAPRIAMAVEEEARTS